MLNVEQATNRSGRTKVLIVDDIEGVRWTLSNVVRLAGLAPLTASSGEEALASILQDMPDVVLLDVGLPDMDGFEVLKRIRTHDKLIPVIMVTAHGKVTDAARAIRDGAYDYIAKPFLNQDVVLTVQHALEEKALKARKRQFVIESTPANSLRDIMGNSLAIQHVQDEVDRIAMTDLSILLSGESGTGKEVVARAIHASSLRADKPFVALDCGAIPTSLIESELFGHEKGAFTGAHQAVIGVFESAAGGTLFLDEIGNLPLAVQSTLLRVLETRCIRRVGGTRTQKIDFRLIAATNVNLQTSLQLQTFRDDLYYRLAEFTIELPALRERSEDIVFLAQRFIDQANLELGRQVEGLSVQAKALLQDYSWPGNVRELRNQVRRAVLLCSNPAGVIMPDLFRVLKIIPELITLVGSNLQAASSGQHACPLPMGSSDCMVPDPILTLDGEGVSLKEIIARMTAQAERLVLLQALRQAHGNKAEAARLVHIDYKTLHSKLKLYKISSLQFKVDSFKSEPNN